MSTAKKRGFSLLLAVAFVLAMIPVATAFASDPAPRSSADVPYSFYLETSDLQWTNDAPWKQNDTSVYVKGNTTGYYTIPAGWRDGNPVLPYIGRSGNAYIGNTYPYFIRNNIYEDNGYSSIQAKLLIQTYSYGSKHLCYGVWSPDSTPEPTINAEVWP